MTRYVWTKQPRIPSGSCFKTKGMRVPTVIRSSPPTVVNVKRWLGIAVMGVMLAACGKFSSPVFDFSPVVEPATQPTEDPRIGDAAPVEIPLAKDKRLLLAIRECNLERVGGQLFSMVPADLAKPAPTTLSGWIASTQAKNVPRTVQIRIVSVTDNRAWAIVGDTGQSREDVRKLLGGDQAYAGAGYALKLDVSSMPVGTYRLFTVFEEGEILKSCDNGRSIRILD